MERGKKLQGQSDAPLNEVGIKQANDAAKKVADLGIDIIYSSDMSRAYQTAQILNQQKETKIIQDKRLREKTFGDYEGRFIPDITKDEWDLLEQNPSALNAESVEDLYKRIKSFIEEIQKISGERNILIVGHAGSIRMMMYCAKYKEFNQDEYNENFNSDKLDIGNATVIKLDLC
ncbi:MAG: histidine phosphatase family protein [Firmicutes bacterium]|nr:histidine phosphatase family protein [Bacillota bacterium]